jgi:hypothetical protein
VAAGLAVTVAPARAAAGHGTWTAPVPGAVTRPFLLGADPFAPGQHRGADFAAAAGATVRAPCSGRVLVARRVGAQGRVATLGCGLWRVTVLPLATLSVRAGDRVTAGARVGTAAGGTRPHDGLHLGVRRASRPDGYVDPLPFLGPAPAARPVIGGGRVPRRGPPAAPEPAPPARSAAAAPEPAPPHPILAVNRTGSSPSAADTAEPVAPWPVWAGLASLLAGAAGAGATRRRRQARPRPRPHAAQGVRSPP